MVKIHLQTNTENKETIKNFFAEAFFNDPYYKHVIAKDVERKEKTQAIFELAFNIGLKYGKIFLNENKTSAAIWLPPHTHINILQAFGCGALNMFFSMGITNALKVKEMAEHIEAARTKSIHTNHWYLMIFAVHPQAHGKGIGSAMLKYCMNNLKTSGESFYLETFNRDNLGFYQRHGFQTVHEISLKDKPVFWTMKYE